MTTKTYVQNFTVFAEASYRMYLINTGSSYSGLQSYQRSGERDLNDEELLRRFFYVRIEWLEQRKLVIVADLVSGGNVGISTAHFTLSRFGRWLSARSARTKYIVMRAINTTLKAKKLIKRHK